MQNPRAGKYAVIVPPGQFGEHLHRWRLINRQERGPDQYAERESNSQNKIEHKETERRVEPTAQRQGVRPKSLPGDSRKALRLPKSGALVKINQHKRHQKITSGKGRP